MNLALQLRHPLLITGLLSALPALATEQISAKDAAAKVKAGSAVVIDVREAEEVRDGGAAEPAILLPMSHVKSQDATYKSVVAGLDPTKEVIVYCASGGRAGKFAAELEKKGFKTGNMGGFRDWQKAGLPVKTPKS